MKTPFIIALGLGLIAQQFTPAWANQKPEQPPLANFDSRQAPATSFAAPSNLQQQSGVALLQSRVSGLRFERDTVTGGPRHLSASRGFLTGVGGLGQAVSPSALNAISPADPHRVVKAFVNEHALLFGHDANALANAEIKADGVTPHNGLRTVIWQQKLDQVPVYGGLFVSHVTKNSELVAVSGRFVADTTQAAGGAIARAQLLANPPIAASEAVRRAAANLGENFSTMTVESTDTSAQGPEKKQDFHSDRLRGEAHGQLVWLPKSSTQVELCWQVILTSRTKPEMYLVLISAQNGEVVLRRCLTSYASPATYNVYTSDSPSPFSPGLDTPSNFQPPILPRSLVTLVALNTNASPAGWINDGNNETRGNNVDSHLDRNDDDLADLPRTVGNPARTFDFPLDLTKGPVTYGDASVVNLFYWNNFMHDKLYELGFTEAFGNFQNTNFNRGGAGNDAVQADAQDGGGFNNANFATPPDGFPGRMQMYLFDGPTPDRDGSLDAEVMCHEYTHGLSNRLLGGGVGISELQPAGMGEGWSDFYALSLLSEISDDPHANYATGGYATYRFYGLQENYYFGIRRYPYSTDMSKNPLTLKDIDPTQASTHAGIPISSVIGGSPADEVHAMGEVWCVTLWEARAALVDKSGADIGNRTMLRLVTDGLKLAPANATFLEARDAILKADEILTGGDNLNELWIAFAKRGFGFSASVPTADTTVGVVEAYDVPDFVTVGPPDGIMEIKVTPGTGTALFGSSTNAISVRITDNAPVTNATIAATLSTGGTLTFRNDGVAPDLTANNAIYTANYVTPAGSTNVTLTLIITAPGKDSSTNLTFYTIVPIPANDNFTNATKVPAVGASYVTSNKRATLEASEPTHAGVISAAASLWWSLTATNNGSVLIDTAGSSGNTVLAVYTNSTLATLQSVVSADDIGTRQQAFVFLNAKSGVTYRIAVASYDTNSTGTIRLAVTPGGIPDTNAPSVTVSAPVSGLSVATNRITITGSAIDPDPNPSGLQDIEFRVSHDFTSGTIQNEGPSGGSIVSSLVSTNWSRIIGLFEGLNTIDVSVKDIAGNRSAAVTLQVTYRPLNPVNDFFVNATTLTGTAGTNSVNTLQATKELGEPIHAGNPGGKSAWWNYQPPADGVLTLSTTNSTFDTLLALYTGESVGTLTKLAENDDAAGGSGGLSALSLAVRSNQVYRIAVDGFDASGGVVFLNYGFTAAKLFHLTINSTAGGSVSPASLDVQSNDTVSVTATANPGYVFELWEGDVLSLANPLSITVKKDRTITARFQPVAFTDGFESGNLTGLGWTTGGNLPWLVLGSVTGAGNFAARSGVIGNSQTSSLLLTGTYRAGIASFNLRVSCEPTWDLFTLLLDGVALQQWSGEIAWTGFSFPITAGAHTLEWRYTKDPNNSSGLDGVFIDNVNLPISVALTTNSPARLLARRLTDGTCFIDLTGQTNQQYVLQASANLQTWQSISTNVAVGGVIHIVDPASLTNSVRFYRALAVP